MITTLAALKRTLQLGAIVTLTSRERPVLRGGHDARGIARRVVRVQGRKIAFESVRPDTNQPSWLSWPKANEVVFAIEESSGKQLFTVHGMTYRIEKAVSAASGRVQG